MEQTRRLASNPKMLYNLFNSWVINGTFLGGPTEKLSKEIGVNIPGLILIDLLPPATCAVMDAGRESTARRIV